MCGGGGDLPGDAVVTVAQLPRDAVTVEVSRNFMTSANLGQRHALEVYGFIRLDGRTPGLSITEAKGLSIPGARPTPLRALSGRGGLEGPRCLR